MEFGCQTIFTSPEISQNAMQKTETRPSNAEPNYADLFFKKQKKEKAK